jgi:hypothetical protein
VNPSSIGRGRPNLFASTTGGVFLSTNNGESWKAVNTGLTDTDVRALALAGTNLFAGTWGGVWKRSIAEMLTSVEEPVSNHAMPSIFSVSQNYPNPFNPETVIRYSIPLRDRVTVDVYNIHGNRITALKDVVEDQGCHSVVWNGKNSINQAVSSGMYLCRIQAGKYRRTIRMLFLK